MIFIDTNILVYAANPQLPFHKQCRAYIEHRRRGVSPWYVSWPVCYEFLRVCTNRRLFARPWSLAASWNYLTTLIESPGAHILLATTRHHEILAQIVTELPHLRGSVLHDVHTAVLMREHGIGEICTRDTDFHRFPFLRVIDPVT
jgi:toxin-antitoxin system PIN domain toxin